MVTIEIKGFLSEKDAQNFREWWWYHGIYWSESAGDWEDLELEIKNTEE